MTARSMFLVIITIVATLSCGCPSKLPSDGRQVQIERSSGGVNIAGGTGGWSIKDGSMLLLRIPGRKADAKEVLPQKAVVHERTLYLLWEDGVVDKFPEPQR